jgi:CRP-like cAMP-binding protein
MPDLLAFLQTLQLSESITMELYNHWKKKKRLEKGGLLTREGEVEQHLYYIHSGNLMIYYEQEEVEQVVGFGYEDTLICSFPSFIRNQPSGYYIRAMSDCTLSGINRTAFYQMLESSSELESVWRKMIEEALLGRIEREIDLLTISPAERLQRLLDRSSHLFQRVPHKYIASYLRMAPETLSRKLKS